MSSACWKGGLLARSFVGVRRFVCFTIAIVALLGLQGCAGLTPQGCGPGLMRMTQAQLFFGRDIERRAVVSDEQWRDFLDQEVTPRFPDGFSVSDVSGQYRDQSSTVVREPSKLLLIFSRDIAADAPKLNAIRDAYRRRFNQESVLLVETPVCAAF